MPTQIRLYTINRGCLLQFAEEWKEKVLPLRIEHGFEIRSATINRETSQFIWLISCDNNENWEVKTMVGFDSRMCYRLRPVGGGIREISV